MKSKKLIIFLCVLAFLTVLIVLNSTLFTLQTISVNWLTSKNELKLVKDYDISSNIVMGDSIFLIKKQEITNSLEKTYPYLRVVSIETRFPNTLVIHSAERESLYAVKLADNEYAILDESAKVLKMTTSSIFAGSELGAKPIKVTFNNISLNPKDFAIGEIVKLDYISNLLSTFSETLREANYTPTTSKGVFVDIAIVAQGSSSEINLKTRNGMVIKLKNAEDRTTDKFLLGIERYNYYHQSGVVTGDIEIWFAEALNKVVARYVDS